MDYSIFYRRAVPVSDLDRQLGKFDYLISAFNSSERVKISFSKINAEKKFWLIHPEYQYTDIEILTETQTGQSSNVGEVKIIHPENRGEISQINALVDSIPDISTASLCIDITGFMRHALAFLLPKLENSGVKKFTAIYSEPVSYKKQEATQFATTMADTVRPVSGMYKSPGPGNNHLLISIGYDHQLIGQVYDYKDSVITHPIFAFPSLSADMYQQSAIRAERSGAVVLQEDWINNRLFAPANDPFATAGIVSERVRSIDRKGGGENIFLSPLSTKAQVLGMSLYWLLEGRKRGRCAILLPECLTYSRETSVGLKRLWSYDVELNGT